MAGNVLELVHHEDPILHKPTERFDFTRPPMDPAQLAEDLVATMRAKNGIGLAANQVGIPYSVLALETDPAYVFFNPKIVEVSQEFGDPVVEGCLSFPGLAVKGIKRPKWVLVRANNPDGSAQTHKFEGMTARVFAHEFAHLQGRTMVDDVPRIHREKVLKDLKIVDRRLKQLSQERNAA